MHRHPEAVRPIREHAPDHESVARFEDVELDGLGGEGECAGEDGDGEEGVGGGVFFGGEGCFAGGV